MAQNIKKKIDLLVFLGDYATGRDDDEANEKSYDDFLTFLSALMKVQILRYPEHNSGSYRRAARKQTYKESKRPLKKFRQLFGGI